MQLGIRNQELGSMDHAFEIQLTDSPKKKPDPDTLKFGKTFTDHMFIMEY